MGFDFSLSARFWRKVQKTDGCWFWIGAVKGNPPRNYGVIWMPDKGYNGTAHRLSWELHFGPIAPEMCVLHRCDNPPCVRPDHLFLGTQDDNIADMVSKRRQRGTHRWGTAQPMHKLTDADVEEIRQVWRPRLSRQLAQRYGVHKATIWSIATGRHWKHTLTGRESEVPGNGPSSLTGAIPDSEMGERH